MNTQRMYVTIDFIFSRSVMVVINSFIELWKQKTKQKKMQILNTEKNAQFSSMSIHSFIHSSHTCIISSDDGSKKKKKNSSLVTITRHSLLQGKKTHTHTETHKLFLIIRR